MVRILLMLSLAGAITSCSGPKETPYFNDSASFGPEDKGSEVIHQLNRSEILSLKHLASGQETVFSVLDGTIDIAPGNYVVTLQCRDTPDSRVDLKVTLYPGKRLAPSSSHFRGENQAAACQPNLIWDIGD